MQKIAAPIFRIQVTKDIAARAQISQAELEAQCQLRPLAKPGRRAPAALQHRPHARPIEYTLLEIILQQPAWANRLPLEHIPDDTLEGAALHAIANGLEQGELPNGGVGLLLEYFRNSPHESVIAMMAGHLAEEVEAGELETVLNDAVEHLRNSGLSQEIDALTARARNAGLSEEERERLKSLLARKSSYKPATSS